MSKDNSQKLLEISDIRNGVIVLKNRALRAILMVSSINFALKSQDEQKAVVYAYQQFLNSLDFSIQITVQSRKLNIQDYLKMLEQKQIQQDNELLRIQASEYKNFIKGLIEMANIMEKGFYIIVPFAPIEAKRESFIKKIKHVLKPAQKTVFTEKTFTQYKEQLWQRIDHIANGLAGIGLKVQALDTPAVLELFYNLYNPS